ncbi:MAG: YhjD/YihY/BrkB family envelope integrity protein [Candidatus Rokuibacteriota bacterium]
MSRLGRFLRDDLWTADPSRLGALGWIVARALRFGAVIVWEFREHALSLRAMSLVYTTLLSLVPLLAVMFSILKGFGAHYRVEPLLARLLEPLGAGGPEITRRLVDFVNNMQVGVLGAVGLIGLFVTAISLLEKVEDALNRVWRVRQARTLGRKFTDYLSFLLVGPVLVFSAFGLIASAQSHWLVQRALEVEPVGGALVVVMSRLVPFLFLCGAFTFLYRFIPHTQVRLTSALVGGASAAILWQLAGLGFTAFIAGSARYAAIYSGFAALVLFLIWLYIAWLVVLIGAEIAYFHQYPSAYLAAHRHRGHLWHERLTLGLLTELTRRHLSGDPPAPAVDLAANLRLPVSMIEGIVDELVSRGMTLRAADPRGIALARAPETITVVEVLDALRDPDARSAAPDGLAASVNEVLELRDGAVRQALDGLTLRSLVSGTPMPDASVPEPSRPARA